MANNYMLNDKFPKAIKNATSTSDGLMSSEDKARFDSIFDDLGVLTPATIDKDGLMSKDDKSKLDDIEEGANNYTHPASHPASMIVTDTTHRFVTDAQITAWNAKATVALATTTTNGLMSATDKTKLDNLNQYIDRKTVFNLNKLIEDKEWGDVNYALGNAIGPFINYLNQNSIPLENGMCILIKTSTKIAANDDGLARNIWQEWIILDKNNYTKKAAWDQLIYRDATQIVSGIMSTADKTKLDTLSNYTHPTTHPASMIVTDTTHRFVTDAQITAWNAKATVALATTTTNGLMSSLDKTKLDTLSNYTHPTTHPASMIVTDTTHRFVTDAQITDWNSKSASIPLATTTTNGLMSAVDKTKLDGITMSVATTTSNGLMSAADKTNLQSLLTRMTQLETNYDTMLAKLKTAVFI